jgi:electron transport complex protein RnfG
MKVLEQKETPGLGDKIEKDTSFVAEFRNAVTPLRGVKNGEGDDSTEIDMITGVTISSRTVIKVINQTLERVGPALAARLQETPQ